MWMGNDMDAVLVRISDDIFWCGSWAIPIADTIAWDGENGSTKKRHGGAADTKTLGIIRRPVYFVFVYYVRRRCGDIRRVVFWGHIFVDVATGCI